jgi:hypothetical protein
VAIGAYDLPNSVPISIVVGGLFKGRMLADEGATGIDTLKEIVSDFPEETENTM